MTTFAPRQPDLPVVVKHAPKVLNSGMGDGYVQRIPDGTNTDLPKIPLAWTNLTQAEATYIDGFFAGLNGVTAFDYQPPHVSYSSAKKFVVQDWNTERVFSQTYTVTADLQQVADPA